MAKKKSRLKNDAFSWVQDTSNRESEAKPKPKTKSRARAKPSTAASKRSTARLVGASQQRSISVVYDEASGLISGIQEKTDGAIEISWSEVGEGKVTGEFSLTGEVEEMALIDIHSNFRVDDSGSTPMLVPI